MSSPISVLIVDDHPLVREGLRSMVQTAGFQVVGEASSGRQAVDLVRETCPDVVLMDVRMPDVDGLTATRLVKQQCPASAVLVLTGYESADYLKRALKAGAAGYILKGLSQSALASAISTITSGGSVVDRALLLQVLNEVGAEPGPDVDMAPLDLLTPREREVLGRLARGLTTKEIAAEMHYSVGTVKNAVQHIIEKLGVSDRTQAAVYAVRAGLYPE
jgi:DNA-binding NarL/FixJ family response regulator